MVSPCSTAVFDVRGCVGLGFEPFVDVMVGSAGPTLLLGSSNADFFSWVDGDESVVWEHLGGSGVGADDPCSADIDFALA